MLLPQNQSSFGGGVDPVATPGQGESILDFPNDLSAVIDKQEPNVLGNSQLNCIVSKALDTKVS